MSYILDALRRADSERERGAIPDLHAQPVPFASDDGVAQGGLRPWAWMAVGVAVALLGLFAWNLMGRETPATAAAPLAPTPAATPVASAEPAPAAAAPAPEAVRSPTPSLPPVVAAVPSPERVPKGKRQAATAEPLQAARSPATSEPAPKPEPAAGSMAPESRIYAVRELPEHIRRELPALAVGGSVFSESAANRMLIINGQVFHEGDKPTSELTLEQIKLKAAVFKYKGYRYELVY